MRAHDGRVKRHPIGFEYEPGIVERIEDWATSNALALLVTGAAMLVLPGALLLGIDHLVLGDHLIPWLQHVIPGCTEDRYAAGVCSPR